MIAALSFGALCLVCGIVIGRVGWQPQFLSGDVEPDPLPLALARIEARRKRVLP